MIAILVGTIQAFKRLYYGIDGNLLEDYLQAAKTILEGARST